MTVKYLRGRLEPNIGGIVEVKSLGFVSSRIKETGINLRVVGDKGDCLRSGSFVTVGPYIFGCINTV